MSSLGGPLVTSNAESILNLTFVFRDVFPSPVRDWRGDVPLKSLSWDEKT